MAQALTVSEDLNEVSDKQTMDIMNLMRYPDYDSYTVGPFGARVHPGADRRQARWAGRRTLLPELATAGLLHDVGKAKVPDEILYKPGKLTEEERKIAESTRPSAPRSCWPRATPARWSSPGRGATTSGSDGGGYPSAGLGVPSPVAGLLQVCDVFEALTAARPYKAPLPPRRAFEIILKDAGAFDLHVVRALVHAIGMYPLGSKVKLTNGCRGFVTKTGDGWGHPTVRVVWSAAGHKLDPDDQYFLDLQDEPGVAVDDFALVGLEAEAPDPLITHHI